MLRVEAESAIARALEFCSKHPCSTCPKSHACVRIFDWIFLSQEVFELAEKCQKFNYAKENE